MPCYRVATPDTSRIQGRLYADFECTQECSSTDDVANLLRRHEFDGCTVWKRDPRAKHWAVIFDTSVPDSDRLPPSLYWLNVAQNERG